MPSKTTRSKQLYIRLSEDELRRLEEAAAERGTTLSDWTRDALLESVTVTAQERRIMACVQAEVRKALLTMEEWQQGKDLSQAEVQARVARLSEQAN